MKYIQSLIFLIVFVLVIFLLTRLNLNLSENKIIKKQEITVVIDYGNGNKRQFRGDGITFEREENAWSVLQRAAATASIPLEVARGFYPIVINGKRNGEESKRWVLYVNGERHGNTIPLDVLIKEGDEVLWKFE